MFLACNNSNNKNAAKQKTVAAQQTPQALTNMGNMQWRSSNYQQALQYFTKAYKQLKVTGDEQQLATLLNSLGLVHWRLENNAAALECYTEAAALAQKHNMQRLLGLTYTNRALILKEQRNFTDAFTYNNKAIVIFKALQIPRDLALAYNNQGQIYRFSGRLQEALYYYLLSLNECEKINYTEGMATAYQNLSTVYAKQGNKNSAISTARKCIRLSLGSNSKVRISEGYRQLADNYDRFGRPDSALYYYKKHYDIEKQLMEASQSNLLSQYQAGMGIEVKNLRIQNLQNEKEIAHNRLLLILACGATVLLAAGFFIYRYRSVSRFKRKQLQLQLQNSLQLIAVKESELKTYIVDLTQKNSLISQLQQEKNTDNIYDEVTDLLKQKILTDEDWDTFKSRFRAIYPGFFTKIQQSNIALTEAEIRILVLMRLQLNGNDMAGILGISPQSVRTCKMRLKKKLLTENFDTVESYLKHIIT